MVLFCFCFPSAASLCSRRTPRMSTDEEMEEQSLGPAECRRRRKWSKGSRYICLVITLLSLAISAVVVFSNGLATHKCPQSLYIVGVVLSNIAISVLLTCTGCAYGVKTKEDVKSAMDARDLDLEADAEFLKTLTGLPTRFTFKAVEEATQNFNHKLGRGGFGSVYEGALSDGSKVAVKRLEREGCGQKEFFAEVATISRIRHLNLVSLKGFCAEGAERLLVYEYMPRGSLDRWIFQDKVSTSQESSPAFTVLSWETRFNIALETARGLAYLHEECEDRILHLDVKPQNILLDDRFHAKVSDFGLSRTMDRGQSRVLTTMRGTPGYLAPEWLTEAGIDSKTDVYGYGMVVLELVSGRRSVDQAQSNPDHWFLPTMAFKKMEEACVMDLVDPLLHGRLDEDARNQVWKMVSIALWCAQEDAQMRPDMSKVVQMLEGTIPVEKPPVWNLLKPKHFPLDLSSLSITVVDAETLTLPR